MEQIHEWDREQTLMTANKAYKVLYEDPRIPARNLIHNLLHWLEVELEVYTGTQPATLLANL